MRPALVVVVPIVLDDNAGLGEGPYLLSVKAFVPEASVEGLYEAVLPGTSGFYVDRLDLLFGQPALEFSGYKFRAIVGSYVLGSAVELHGAFNEVNHILGFKGAVCTQDVTFTGIFIEHRKHADRSSSSRGVSDKVPRPDVVLMVRLRR